MRRWHPAVEHPLINQLAEQADADRVGRQAASGVGQPVADQSRRSLAAHPRGRRPRRAEGFERRTPAAGAARDRRSATQRRPRRRPCRGDPQLLPPAAGLRRHRDPAQSRSAAGPTSRAEHRPDELAKLADKLTDCLNPDGDFTDVDRAKRRGITIGNQDIDGMSPISGYLTPEARATIDAVFAKLAAPGMCNSADDDALRQRHTLASRHSGRHPQRLGSATTTPCSPPPAPYWPPVSSANTTGCPPASSSPPHCRNWKPAPAKRSPAAAPCYRCPM